MASDIPTPQDRITTEEFEALPPRVRGYYVFIFGGRYPHRQPNIPQESNPYPDGSPESDLWLEGQIKAAFDCEADIVMYPDCPFPENSLEADKWRTEQIKPGLWDECEYGRPPI